VIAQDGATSALINEEDHLRMQTILPGLDIDGAYRACLRAESALAGRTGFAQNNWAGYLTTALTNAGTGMRMSALVHLPVLEMSGAIELTLEAARETGSTVRGFFGEGSDAAAGFYQVSNSAAWGVDCQTIARRVESTARYLVKAEHRAREALSQETGCAR